MFQITRPFRSSHFCVRFSCKRKSERIERKYKTQNLTPSHNFRNQSPEQNQENHELNGRRSTNGIDITKIYTQGMDNNNKKTINNNNNNVEKMGETRTKPTRDITQIYTQGKKKSIIGLLPTRKFLLAANRTLSGCLSVADRVLTGFA